MLKKKLASLIPHSMRTRLPLSYAAIALVTAVAVGAVLLMTLRSYYAERELDRMNRGAGAIGFLVERMLEENTPVSSLQTRLDSFAFFSQAQVRVLNPDHQLIAESTNPSGINMVYFRGPNTEDTPSNTKMLFEVQSFPGDAQGEFTMPAPFGPGVPDDGQAGTRVFVDGSPYGVHLKPDWETNGRVRSDQKATTTLLNSKNQVLGYLEIFDGPAIGSEIVDRVAWALIGASVIAILVAALAGWSISRVITTPLLGLKHITDQMAQGDLTVRAKIDSSDEFGSLARAFNHMTNQVEHTITTLKCFLADAAHELHTPITALNTNLELAATENDDVTRQSFIERALEQLKRLETLTNNLLILSRIETHSLPDERHAVDLGALVRETSELYASQAEQVGITFMIDAPSEPTIVMANEAQLRRTLCNLLDNAIKFTAENGCVELGLRKDGTRIKLWVQDTGIGIPAEDMPYLFNRFHRGRNTAAYPGNGLGLAIIKAIVESHQGKVAVDSLSPGTRFTLLLPS
jgi:signal transduction histidine kinase